MTQEIEWQEWAQAVAERIQRKSRQGESSDCILWTGATTQSRANSPSYGYMKVKLPSSQTRKSLRVHVLAYLVTNIRLRDILLSKDRDFDISHLCHNSLCTNIQHLVAEDKALNNLRKACKRSGHCLGHGDHKGCLL